MGKYFTVEDMDSLIFFQVPKVLVLGERYRSMKPNALKLYMVLFDRMKLSMTNGWKDSEGRFYVRMSQDGAAELFGWSPTTYRSMKKELESYGLLEQDREGQGKTNRLYVLKCEYDEKDVYILNKTINEEMEENEKQAQVIDEEQKNNFKPNLESEIDYLIDGIFEQKDKSCSSAENIEKNKSCSSRRSTVVLLEGQQLTTNNNNINNNDFNKNNLKDNKSNIVNNIVNNKQNIIDDLIFKYMNKGLSKEVCLRVVKEVESREPQPYNFGGFLRTCLENTLYKSKLKNGSIEPGQKIKERALESEIPYYDWFSN